jgi:hypothetical protein
MRLDAAQLEDGVVTRDGGHLLVDRLSRGLPISVVAIGASVAVQGGCFDQAEAECMKYAGAQHVDLGFGRSGRFKGFLVEWFEWMNRTWPHPQHSLVNRAAGGTALQTILPCLFGTLPARVDLVVLEVGSMAKWLSPSAVELAVRKFLLAPSPPAILFVTVPMWYRREFIAHESRLTRSACQDRFSQNDFRMTVADKAAGSATPWSKAERVVERVCRHYEQSCISLFRALAPAMRERRPGFSLADVAQDCVHPLHGKHGSHYVAELMVHWLTLARANMARSSTSVQHGNRVLRADARSSKARPRLPRVLYGREVGRQMRAVTACYFFHADGGLDHAAGDTTWMVIPWRSADCSSSGGSAMPTDVDGQVVARSCAPLPRAHCPATKDYERTLSRWGGVWPRGWIHCDHTISPRPRLMKNLAAFTPGALAYLSLERPPFLTSTATNTSADAVVKLLHLISYEHMGVVRVTCIRGCTCGTLDIDGHHIDPRGRNVSIYVEATLPIRFSFFKESALSPRQRCVVGARVLHRTSSGEHRFVLTRVTVSSSISD